MKRFSILYEFTKNICELTSFNGQIRSAVLDLCSGRNIDSSVKKLAVEVNQGLETGAKLSSVLSRCVTVDVPAWYWGFVSTAEECGKVERTFSFLYSQLSERKKSFNSVIEASVYPLFVVVLSMFCACCLRNVIESTGTSAGFTKSFIVSFLFLLSVVISTGVSIYRFFSTDRMLLFIQSMSFLTSASVPLIRALDCSFKVISGDKKLEKIVLEIRRRILESEKPGEVFLKVLKNAGFEREGKAVASNLFVSGQTNTSTGFERCAEELLEARKRKQRFFLSIQQPLMIVLAGIYLVLLLKDSVVPVLTGGLFGL